jgi:hypothetical protein
MNKIVTQIADIITSLGTVIFVLLMTVIAMIFVGHGLYHQVFLKVMPPWQADAAAWVLSFGVETTVLVITCNVKYFSSRQLPVFFAICSGFIVLFFIKAFDTAQPLLDISIRWFMGLLVSGVNFVYCELFVKKFQDTKNTIDLVGQIETLKQQNKEYYQELATTKFKLTDTERDVDQLVHCVTELEAFKKKAIAEKSCGMCGKQFPSVFHLNAHVRTCDANQKQGDKLSILKAAV